MPLYITKAEIFDPALSGEFGLPARLEITVSGLPEAPTYSETVGLYRVDHFSWLAKIYGDDAFEWYPEDNDANAALFNNSIGTGDREAVVPITVVNGDDPTLIHGMTQDFAFGEEYFIKLTRAQRIARRIEKDQGHTGYEWLPNPEYVKDKLVGWHLQHANRMCVECVYEKANSSDPERADVDVRGIPDMCKLYKVAPFRLVPMCARHSSVINDDFKSERLFWEEKD